MFSSTDRLVRLDSGEALFEVAHDPNRPFIVEAGLISIEALGTQFDVYRRSVSTRVTVIDGAVQISSKGTTLSSSAKPLTVLQQLDVPDDIAQARVRRNLTPGDLERMAAWTHGDMVLEIQTPTEMREGVAR
jgi:transmembrane sensor